MVDQCPLWDQAESDFVDSPFFRGRPGNNGFREEEHIMRTIKRAMHFVFCAVLIGYGTFAVTSEAASQEAGWITLFDGKDLDGWDQVGGSNWHVADGAIVADTMADKKEAGYLVTKNSYK